MLKAETRESILVDTVTERGAQPEQRLGNQPVGPEAVPRNAAATRNSRSNRLQLVLLVISCGLERRAQLRAQPVPPLIQKPYSAGARAAHAALVVGQWWLASG